ncbi:Estrogen sulfotransferase [Heterocephalus glaber]|uniref:Sulfotransferase n=1 Tax=Heterocephalus glaber TaxID=10181 RepID=G5AYC1_HETGA|nr:Estrogen sulfotransferase [Heterocephalus glaber]
MDSSKHDYYEIFGEIHGILLYKDFIKYWDDVEAFQARPDDLVIAGYLKSVPYGSWYDHVKSWWAKNKDSHVLFIFYEDMKEDIRKEVMKLMQFLGRNPSEELVDKIIQHTSFQEMKNNLSTNYTMLPEEIMNQKVSPFMRKGTVRLVTAGTVTTLHWELWHTFAEASSVLRAVVHLPRNLLCTGSCGMPTQMPPLHCKLWQVDPEASVLEAVAR